MTYKSAEKLDEVISLIDRHGGIDGISDEKLASIGYKRLSPGYLVPLDNDFHKMRYLH